MSVTVLRANIFDASLGADALVVTVNCVGAMGRGNAAEFKAHFPHLFIQYKALCHKGVILPGKIGERQIFSLPDKRLAILFPSKNHFKDPTRLSWIESGLSDLQQVCRKMGVKRLALPPPGCGNGWVVDLNKDVLPPHPSLLRW